jgi:hypothetical protein
LTLLTITQSGVPEVEAVADDLGGTRLKGRQPIWYTILGLAILTAALGVAWRGVWVPRTLSAP